MDEMFTIIETTTISRPRAEVFAFLIDSDNRPLWDPSVVFERLTSPGPVALGSTIHSRVRAVGRENDFHWRVTDFVAPERLATVSTSGPVHTEFLLEFSDADLGCTVRATIDASPAGLMRLVEPMISETVRATLATSLARAQVLLEGR